MYCFVYVVQVSARVSPCKDYGNFRQVKDFLPYEMNFQDIVYWKKQAKLYGLQYNFFIIMF